MSEKLKIAVIADVHGNLPALEVVLAKLNKRGFDALWFLGDSVNYGPWPAECVDLIRAEASFVLAGNHDYLVCGKHARSLYGGNALQNLDWTVAQLGEERLAYLCGLTAGSYLKVPEFAKVNPVMNSSTKLKYRTYWKAQNSANIMLQGLLKSTPLLTQPPVIQLVHGSPRDLVAEYMVGNNGSTRANMMYTLTGLLLFGHSHIPTCFKLENGQITHTNLTQGEPVVFNPYQQNFRIMLNPGSVGQPRDGDSRASYAILSITGDPTSMDSSWSFVVNRVRYEVEQVVQQLVHHSLSTAQGTRLRIGS